MSIDLIQCAVCRESMKAISWRHLAKHHSLTLSEYKEQYPNSPIRSETSIQLKKDAAKRANASRIGVCRSDEVKRKIKLTKAKNPKEAWNKGISRTEEQNKHLSEVRKAKYASGDFIHWNTGKHWSEEVKQKISKTALNQGRVFGEESKRRRKQTIQQKIEDGWIHHSIVCKGKPSSMSDETREKLSKLSTERNEQKVIDSFSDKNQHLQQYGLFIQHSDGYNFDIHCSICGTTFSRTTSVLVPYRYDIYKGEYCPTCFPPQYGYYSESFFEKNPKLKDQFGILYIAIVDDTEQFIKVGITNRTAHQRLWNEPYNFEILLEVETTIYDAYLMEQEILTKYKHSKYTPLVDFGGKTECLDISILDGAELDEIIEKYINRNYS